MCKSLWIICACACATVAHAGTFQLFFSTQGIPDLDHAAVPAVGNPSVTPAQLVDLKASDGNGSQIYTSRGTGLYLWGKLTYASTNPHWIGMAFQVVTTGNLTTPGITLYNDTEYGQIRWDNRDGQTALPLVGPNAAGKTIAATTGYTIGIGMKPMFKPGGAITGGTDWYAIGDTTGGGPGPGGGSSSGPYDAYYLLGYLPVSGTRGTIKLGTFTNFGGESGGWIVQAGSPPGVETVYFGAGDAAVNNRPDAGVLAVSDIADATITPEPASLALVALAALALCRR